MKYCANCSSIMTDGDAVCPNCGTAAGNASNPGQSAPNPGQASPDSASFRPGHENPPPKYLAQSVLALIFCCWALAIPALVYNGRIDKLFNAGKKDEAWEASETAKKWLIASVITNGVIYVIAIGLQIAASVMRKNW